jgi:hypothetical protein
MQQMLVAVRGHDPVTRSVEIRTPQLRRGVLCDVWIDERPELCLVEQVIGEREIVVTPLPGPPGGDSPPRLDARKTPRRHQAEPADSPSATTQR